MDENLNSQWGVPALKKPSSKRLPSQRRKKEGLPLAASLGQFAGNLGSKIAGFQSAPGKLVERGLGAIAGQGREALTYAVKPRREADIIYGRREGTLPGTTPQVNTQVPPTPRNPAIPTAGPSSPLVDPTLPPAQPFQPSVQPAGNQTPFQSATRTELPGGREALRYTLDGKKQFAEVSGPQGFKDRMSQHTGHPGTVSTLDTTEGAQATREAINFYQRERQANAAISERGQLRNAANQSISTNQSIVGYLKQGGVRNRARRRLSALEAGNAESAKQQIASGASLAEQVSKNHTTLQKQRLADAASYREAQLAAQRPFNAHHATVDKDGYPVSVPYTVVPDGTTLPDPYAEVNPR